jgi:tRNA pseudouridine55 synthase
MVRRALGIRRVGHTGTLDPMATGVLLVCVGKATRLARFLAESDKTYRARVRFGFATDTEDAMGEPLGPKVEVSLSQGRLAEACRDLVGPLEQVPPAYSAKRVGGKRLYDLARRGTAVERRAVSVVVHSLDLIRLEGETAEIDVRCSAGTYVRAIARDLGSRLGVGAHLAALRRTSTGGFGLERSLPASELTPELAATHLLPMSAALQHLPAVIVADAGRQALRRGQNLTRRLVVDGFPEVASPRVRVLDAEQSLIGLAVPQGFGYDVSGLSVEPAFHPDVVLID